MAYSLIKDALIWWMSCSLSFPVRCFCCRFCVPYKISAFSWVPTCLSIINCYFHKNGPVSTTSMKEDGILANPMFNACGHKKKHCFVIYNVMLCRVLCRLSVGSRFYRCQSKYVSYLFCLWLHSIVKFSICMPSCVSDTKTGLSLARFSHIYYADQCRHFQQLIS